MKATESTNLWCRPRPASKMLGIAYSTVVRLAREGAIPAKTYYAGKRKRYLIEVAWILARGGKVA